MTCKITKLTVPTADELDTGDWPDDYRRDLYLIPASEADGDLPEVTTHGGVGNIGQPMMSFHHRWAGIGGYGASVQGQGILEILCGLEDELVAVSDAYLGSEWDGSNHIGQWSDDGRDYDGPCAELCEAWSRAVDHGLPSYWDAGDWFGPAGDGWGELCEAYGVDPHRALGTDEERAAAVEDLRRAIRKEGTDEPVAGIGTYLADCAGEWEPDIDDDEIDDLRTEAGQAGDREQVAICDRALDGDLPARAECARVIADAATAAE